MPDYLGDDMRKQKTDKENEEDKPFQGECYFHIWIFVFSFNRTLFLALDEGDIAVLKRYGQGPYSEQLKQL